MDVAVQRLEPVREQLEAAEKAELAELAEVDALLVEAEEKLTSIVPVSSPALLACLYRAPRLRFLTARHEQEEKFEREYQQE